MRLMKTYDLFDFVASTHNTQHSTFFVRFDMFSFYVELSSSPPPPHTQWVFAILVQCLSQFLRPLRTFSSVCENMIRNAIGHTHELSTTITHISRTRIRRIQPQQKDVKLEAGCNKKGQLFLTSKVETKTLNKWLNMSYNPLYLRIFVANVVESNLFFCVETLHQFLMK